MYVYLHSVSTRCAFKFIHQSRASWPTKELARVKRKEHTLSMSLLALWAPSQVTKIGGPNKNQLFLSSLVSHSSHG